MKDPIYLQDSYLKEYVTKVKQIDSNKIIVEDSLFYPTSGGQPNDLGKVIFNDNIYNVNDVRKISGEIQISLDSDSLSFSVGDEIVMELDFERRYKLMRMHSCAHLLSYVVFKNTNALISGNSLSLEKSRIDFDLENFDKEQFFEFEKEANDLIKQKIEILSYFLDRKKAFEIPSLFRLKSILPPNVEKLRIVELKDLDKQACGGTHVKNTSEIGEMKILKLENRGKNNRRLYFTLV